MSITRTVQLRTANRNPNEVFCSEREHSCEIFIPDTGRVKGYTRFVGKYITGKRNRFRPHGVCTQGPCFRRDSADLKYYDDMLYSHSTDLLRITKNKCA